MKINKLFKLMDLRDVEGAPGLGKILNVFSKLPNNRTLPKLRKHMHGTDRVMEE